MSQRQAKTYVGVHNDKDGGLSDAGRIIQDAWVFGLLPESEDGSGWSRGRIEALYDQVYKAWEPYGHLVSNLPPDLKERHQRIYAAAVERARSQGWDPDGALADES